MDILHFVLSLIFAYIACFGFGFIFHIRGRNLFITPIGGVIIWGTYLLLENPVSSIIVRAFLATMAAAIFCEIIARVLKAPVTVFMIISILPLVPGSGIYYTMQACIKSDYNAFIEKGIETIGIAGAIAVGMLIVSTIFKMGTLAFLRLKKN
ncbi:MAG: threonine/serine exporter [Ruminococcaceae bacterium]|nr:threonine/serine exporter [Oscillospiraceae bacterium]